MKRVLYIVASLLLAVSEVYAEGQVLQHFSNYQVQSLGNNVLRFTIPVWAKEGALSSMSYYAIAHKDNNDDTNDSYVWYSTVNGDGRGSGSVHRIASFGTAQGMNNASSSSGYAYLSVQSGSAVIVNTYDGTPHYLTPGDLSRWIDHAGDLDHCIQLALLGQCEGCPCVHIQFDWYIPDELQDQNFYVGLNAQCYDNWYIAPQGACWWQWDTQFSGTDMPQTPQLFEPYFYSMVSNGVNTLGKAAIQYVTYQDPISYRTSLDPNTVLPIKERSGSIIVTMADSVQDNFHSDFHVKTDDGSQLWLPSNNVSIPAYHKIYNFGASQVFNAQQSITGDVQLQWQVRHPESQDIMESDMFEIQRAVKPDFSDAQSVGLLPWMRDSAIYQFTDLAENVLAALSNDTSRVDSTFHSELSDIEIYDGNKLVAMINASMNTDIMEAGNPLYYRVRRASAATWGWNESPYMATAQLLKANYLAPLAIEQPPYTLDADFENNRTVHFNLKISNDSILPLLPDKDSLTFDYNITSVYNITVPLTIDVHGSGFATFIEDYYYTATQDKGDHIDTLSMSRTDWQMSNSTLTTNAVCGIPVVLSISHSDATFGTTTQSCTFTPTYGGKADVSIYSGLDMANLYIAATVNSFTPDSICEPVDSVFAQCFKPDSIKTMLYNDLYSQLQPLNAGGRCIWDSNAKIIITRTHVETGETRDMVVPQDSIILQPDGSYRVRMSDVAALSCMHYAYSVRMDQTNSLLKVQYPDRLNPIALTGPDVYYNQSAKIATFEATDGTNKRGVILSWEPTAGSLDAYTLLRREKGSEAAYDTIAVLTTEGYFDEQTTPGVYYEYLLKVQYTCNGTTTGDEATTVGRRSPYGSIAGRVQYEDGTGCPGITVQLCSADSSLQTSAVTDALGAYKFDSLLYGVSTTYSIVPTSQTAQFHYNNTSSGFATITLTAENNEVERVTFDNISSVRFTGRVLFKNSSIPVRDANILLNGTLVNMSGGVYKTDISGDFNILVPKSAPFTLQIVKDGHTLEDDGFVRINGDSVLTLTEQLDGVRLWDLTKVRLAGRLVGGLDQAALPLGFGLSTNNLGDNLQMIFELEGDNVSYVVRDPNDLTKDTLEFTVAHEVLRPDGSIDTVGTTQVHYQHKRIIINPDPVTGEYAADLFPVKYKIVQATAQGYATLFGQGQTGETLDLTGAVLTNDTSVYDSLKTARNAIFSITYRSPIVVTYKQSRYGLDYDYFGVRTYQAQSLDGKPVTVDLVTQDSLGNWNYLFGAPIFPAGQYQFRVQAHEDYYYNNDRSQIPDMVYLKGGTLKVYNGLRETTTTETMPLDQNGSALVNVTADHVSYLQANDNALHSLDFSVMSEGEYIEAQPLRAFILGAKEKAQDIMHYNTTETGITLLDILRDPPGSGSSAYLEKGTTYEVKYKTDYNYRFGLEFSMGVGNNNQFFVGTYAGVGAGVSAGVINILQQTSEFTLPITIQYVGEHEAQYSFTTNQRIETSSDPDYVGAMADVFIGVTQGVHVGKADAFRIVDSVSYNLLQGQIDNGNAMVVMTGVSADGKPWYLMRTEDVLLKQDIVSSFAYTQEHIISFVIPEQIYYRNSLLLTGSREEAKAAAAAQNKAVYWSKVSVDDVNYGQGGYYEIIKPANYSGTVIDKVALANVSLNNWLKVLETNEREKVNTQYDTPLQTLSISGGLTQSYAENYEYANFRSSYVGYPFADQTGDSQMSGAGGFAMAALKQLFAAPVLDQLAKHLEAAGSASEAENPASYVRAEVGTVKFEFHVKPVVETSSGNLPENGLTEGTSKGTGYTIALDQHEHLTFNVYKSKVDVFNDDAKETREEASNFDATHQDSYLFGSLMYRTVGGATRCPWEGADSTFFYNPGTQLNYATQRIENPQIVIDKHEVSNVPHDQPARFNLTMWNELDDVIAANAGLGLTFNLRMDENSNPTGAKISIDGEPLLNGHSYHFNGAEALHKVIEVRAGEGYDYEDLCLVLSSECGESRKVYFSVHYMPVSTDVAISIPSDKWIMNTLSSKDEQGYYIPVSIDGFDVNYKGFDHIELQYKLVTQSNDAWVNLCSFYVSDSLYNLASGTKELIKNGRIDNYRFYGERDPMEQQYNLRAVSFCRYGSGFITKSSPVLSGTKDTRPPRVFGEPEPADAILGVTDNLRMRFNEAIAGNYLDEDNNFQVLGTTNSTDITDGTSLHFDGTDDSYAVTSVARALTAKSFTVDMLVRPDTTTRKEIFFSHGSKGLEFGKTVDNRLFVTVGKQTIYSSPLANAMTAFTRVLLVYDHASHTVRFYAGTEEVTNSQSTTTLAEDYNVVAPLVWGKGLKGDMMEARLWTHALTPAQIADTHMKRLTGYEYGLVDYYPMSEGRGVVLKDKAGGATANIYGADWNLRKGLSMHFDGSRGLTLNSDVLSRLDIQDETFMMWFKTAQAKGTLFSAGRADSVHGTAITFDNGNLVLCSDSGRWTIGAYADNEWHHISLTVNRTSNIALVYIDGAMTNTFAASKMGGISGAMMIGSNGYMGNIDVLTFFEQALPKTLIQEFDNILPSGDEMGLMGYLPFSMQKESVDGVMETVFSPNDQRTFRDSEGNVVNKQVALVTDISGIDAMIDKTEFAPVREHEHLTKLLFDWSFNGDELMINLNMPIREINKQNIYVTVRDVEDMNGNPMVSPVMWTAFVDRNALKWDVRQVQMERIYDENNTEDCHTDISFTNKSGKRHQFTVESLPDWLTVSPSYGSIEPTDFHTLRFTFSGELPVGLYSALIYLTDEDGLAEPLTVEYKVTATCPWDSPNPSLYTQNMSVCGQVLADNAVYDTDDEDRVIALYRNECVGMANVNANADIYLTIFGNEPMNGKTVNFVLWKASTGKVLSLTPSQQILFANNSVYGCGNDQPVLFTIGGSETQNIALNAGWNWISFNVDVQEAMSPLNTVMTASQPWAEGDIIKNPSTQKFVTYSHDKDAFVGTFEAIDYRYMYMAYSKNGNLMRVSANTLPADSMHITLHGNGQWTAFPCLLSDITSVTEALADYYDHAAAGDLIKAHDRFAVFSADKHWVGDLTALRPGEGYLFKRLATDDMTVRFFDKPQSNAPKKAKTNADNAAFTNPNAATNMTMICTLSGEAGLYSVSPKDGLYAYIGDELVGVATPVDSLYFLTISSDAIGSALRFETEDGTVLTPVEVSTSRSLEITYQADAHHGSLKAPIILKSSNPQIFKLIENNHVIIIRNNEKYDVTGKKL